MRKVATIFVLFLALLGAVASEPTLRWRNYEFREISALAALPTSIQEQLGAHISGLGGIADRGRPFNSTDVVDSARPMRRLVAAGQSGDTWLVALEHGGIASNVEVYLFSSGVQRQHWVLPISRPQNLQAVIQQLPAVDPSEG